MGIETPTIGLMTIPHYMETNRSLDPIAHMRVIQTSAAYHNIDVFFNIMQLIILLGND